MMASAAITAAPARGTSVRTTWILARSTSIAATIVPMATTAPLAASDNAGVDDPANGIATRSAAPVTITAAIGQAISPTRSSGP
jgi:hypothetical protein